MNTPPRFSIIPAMAMRDRRIKPRELHVLCALGTYADNLGWCYPLQTTLEGDTGLARETINRAIKRLVELGYVEVRSRCRRLANGKYANEYRVLFDLTDDQAAAAAASRIADDVTVSSRDNSDVTEPSRDEASQFSRDPQVTQNVPIYSSLRSEYERPIPISSLCSEIGARPEKSSGSPDEVPTKKPPPTRMLTHDEPFTDRHIQIAAKEGVTDDRAHAEWEQFTVHHVDKRARRSERGWQLAWSNWCKRAVAWEPGRATGSSRADAVAARAERVRRRIDPDAAAGGGAAGGLVDRQFASDEERTAAVLDRMLAAAIGRPRL